jgi:polyisoprenyl-teichoic acid--peptidoglycan teichoic acid transferase
MTTPIPSPAAHQKRRRPLRALAAVLALVLVAGIGVGAWYVLRANLALNAIARVNFDSMAPGQPTDSALPGVDTAPQPTVTSAAPSRPEVAPETAGLNFLLMGTDLADGGVSRSDSLMVLHVSADRSKIFVISYPRDSYVDIPGHGKGKINWAYQWGGVPLAKQTIEQLSGVGIDHTLHVDFEGFIGLTGVLGGVTVYNPYDVTVGKYHYPVGDVELSGEKALMFVRNRYNLPHWDLDRAANQRNVIKAIIVKAMRPATLANPATFVALLSGAAACIQVDTGLTDDVVRDLALSMKLSSNEDVVLMQAPISGFGSLPNGDSIDVVDWPKMDALSAAIRSDTIGDYVAKYGKRGY